MTGAPRATSDPSFCKACLEKQRKIDALQEENKRLKDKLRRQERTAREEPFGSSTPSAKRLVKSSSPPEARARRGGAVPGHDGHGRSTVLEDEADTVETLAAPETCPDCGCALEDWGVRDRTVHDCAPVRRTTRLIHIGEGRCPKCGTTHRRRVPGVLPKSGCSNRLVAQTATWSYAQGHTLGGVARQFELRKGTLIGQMHALADRFAPVDEALVAAYRLAPVKHADETGWRNDGCNGNTWGFFTPHISIFRCRDTRSGDVAEEVLGTPEMHVGTLHVDRYAGYNRFRGDIQYCYAHLKRDAEDVAKKNPDSPECAAFAEAFAPLLAEAMRLRSTCGDETSFLAAAASLRSRIEACVNRPARHPSIQHIQSLFREKAHRMYHWTRGRHIPADNNRAERELRPLVIARKISFGSQSDRGLRTREILMTVLNTLAKRTDDVVGALTRTLDAIVDNPELDVAAYLFGPAGIAPVPKTPPDSG